MEKLRNNPLFSGLSESQFGLLAASAKGTSLKEGHNLFSQKQKADYFYFLETGDIKLFRLSADGAEKVIELIRPGQTFAEAVMFMHGNSYPVTAQALTDCQLISIEMAVFRTLLENSPATCLNILGHMSQRLHGLVQEIEQLTLKNAKIRVIRFLLQGLPGDVILPYQVRWNTPKTVLASRLSIRPETFSRILAQLSQDGLIKVNNKTIEILNIEQLRAF